MTSQKNDFFLKNGQKNPLLIKFGENDELLRGWESVTVQMNHFLIFGKLWGKSLIGYGIESFGYF